MGQYNESQVKDITEREKKALDFLKELQLSPACQAQLVNVGNDTFAIKLFPYLSDLKFVVSDPVRSPDEFLPPEKTT